VHDAPLLELSQSHEQLAQNVLGELDPQLLRPILPDAKDLVELLASALV